MNTAARVSVIVVGGVAVLAALFGLYYNGTTLILAIRGSFSEQDAQQKLTYFYPVFYSMSAICITFYFLLLVSGIALLRVRLGWSGFLSWLLLFEVIYFFSIGFLWLIPNVGMSIAAASGVANEGLMVQFIILFPLWAPLVLWWARRKLEQVHP